MKKLILSFSLLITSIVSYAQKEYITCELTDGLGNTKLYKFELYDVITYDSCQFKLPIKLMISLAQTYLKGSLTHPNSLQYTPNDNNIVGRISNYIEDNTTSDSIPDKRVIIHINYKSQNDYGGFIMSTYHHTSEKSCERQKYEEIRKKQQEEKEKQKKLEDQKRIEKWKQQEEALKKQQEETLKKQQEEALKRQSEKEARIEKENQIRKKQGRFAFFTTASIIILPSVFVKLFYKEKV